MNEHSNISNIIAFWIFLPLVVMTRVGVGLPCLVAGYAWGAISRALSNRHPKQPAKLD